MQGFVLQRIASGIEENSFKILLGAPKETLLRKGIYFFLFATFFTPVLYENETRLQIGRNKRGT
jgi:hypothetical protein